MVSTRRTQEKDDEADDVKNDGAAAAAAAAAKTREAQSPSTRRTRSNSTAVVEETGTQEDNITTKKKKSSIKKNRRKRRGSSDVDNHDETTVQESVVKEVVAKEHDTSVTDLPAQPSAKGGEQEPQTSLVNTATKHIAKRPSKDNKDSASDDNTTNGNELTKLIPGYIAPLKLDTSLLDSYRPSGGLAALTRQAQQTDASTAGFVVNAPAEPHTQVMKKKTSNGCMPTTYTSLYSSFKHGAKRATDHSAGAGWFNMQPTQMTDELKTDLAVIRNRNYLDPKRFYKSADNDKNKVMQVGTVIEGSAEFYSSRLTKKQRRTNLTEEIMADPESADYTKRKYKRMQQEKTEKGQKYNKKKMSKRARRGY